MSALSDFIFANSNESYFGKSSPFGDPRDVYINGINREMTNAISTGKNQTWQSSGIFVGSFRNDYLTSYNWTVNEVDIVIGGRGADTFVAGDGYGVHYTNVAISIVADYKLAEGDVVQLSAKGAGRYSFLQGNFGLGGATVDTVLYYNNDAIMALADTARFNWKMV
jgi:hypothetical protein